MDQMSLHLTQAALQEQPTRYCSNSTAGPAQAVLIMDIALHIMI